MNVFSASSLNPCYLPQANLSLDSNFEKKITAGFEDFISWTYQISDFVVNFFNEKHAEIVIVPASTSANLIFISENDESLTESSLESSLVQGEQKLESNLSEESCLLREKNKLAYVNKHLRHRYDKKSQMLAQMSQSLQEIKKENERLKSVISFALLLHPALIKDYKANRQARKMCALELK